MGMILPGWMMSSPKQVLGEGLWTLPMVGIPPCREEGATGGSGEREGIKGVTGKGWDELHVLFLRVFILANVPSTPEVAHLFIKKQTWSLFSRNHSTMR